ncbi:MAG: hypothetical protein K8T20_17040 [Planctomycetes bacterium]|nr:hypothetical protein [Planctomycetota bacterium]
MLFESVTCAFRWGFDLQSTRDTAFIAPLTFGVRVHHGYVGALCSLGSVPVHGPLAAWALRIGLALLVSDVVHHFVVLRWTTGDPQFDLTYPRLVMIEAEREAQEARG